jgi:hypothetical protein
MVENPLFIFSMHIWPLFFFVLPECCQPIVLPMQPCLRVLFGDDEDDG